MINSATFTAHLGTTNCRFTITTNLFTPNTGRIDQKTSQAHAAPGNRMTTGTPPEKGDNMAATGYCTCAQRREGGGACCGSNLCKWALRDIS